MEFLDIVDTQDNVVGKASREQVYREKLSHRIVHVLIFNEEGNMALQLRSSKVSFCPNHWSTTVGGHVLAGENYDQAAKREYAEELGAESNLAVFAKEYYEVPGAPKKFLVIYKTKYDGPFNPDPNEVEKVDFFSFEEIQKMIEKGEKFHPERLFLLKKYFI